MARPVGTREIPAVYDKNPKKQQFFEEVKFRLDNGITPAPSPAPPPVFISTLNGSGIAGQDIQAFRVVTTDSLGQVIYADGGNPNHFDQVLGVSLESVASGQAIDFILQGELVNENWSFTPGEAVFLGLGGTITHNESYVQIGYAITDKRISVRVDRNKSVGFKRELSGLEETIFFFEHRYLNPTVTVFNSRGEVVDVCVTVNAGNDVLISSLINLVNHQIVIK